MGIRAIIDTEWSQLKAPHTLHCAVARDADNPNNYEVFDGDRLKDFPKWLKENVDVIIGHNFLGFDLDSLNAEFPGLDANPSCVIDTLVCSRLFNHRFKGGHSVENYAERFASRDLPTENRFGVAYPKGLQKVKIDDWSVYTDDIRTRCISDTLIQWFIWNYLSRWVALPNFKSSLKTEHYLAYHCKELEDNGFGFDRVAAEKLKGELNERLSALDVDLRNAFPPVRVLVDTINPRATKRGTIHSVDFRRLIAAGYAASEIEVGKEYPIYEDQEFNPGSLKQIIDRLWDAGWKPTEKTKGHSEAIKAKDRTTEDMDRFRKYGWTLSENNLRTLPDTAPQAAQRLVERLLVASRLSDLDEWLGLIECELKIKLESIDELGLEGKELWIQNGEHENGRKIKIDTKDEIWKNTELNTNTNFTDLNKKNESADVILKGLMDFRSKIMIQWLKINKVNVGFAIEKDGWLLITIMRPEKSEDCSATVVMSLLDGLKPRGLRYEIISEKIKSKFFHIGSWTQRMATSEPNMQNIPVPQHKDKPSDLDKLSDDINTRMRSLWIPEVKGNVLVGTDADGIQMRVFAHYVNDPRLTQALINGDKKNQTDIHSVHWRALGPACKGRNPAKTFIYAWLLGAGKAKVAEILECSFGEAGEAVERFIEFYPGLSELKQQRIPRDAANGYFEGLDKRLVLCDNTHLMLAGYLQNGEKVIMAKALSIWKPKLIREGVYHINRNFVHDEWQTETRPDLADYVGGCQADAIRKAGEELGLNCPLAGQYKIGRNWLETH